MMRCHMRLPLLQHSITCYIKNRFGEGKEVDRETVDRKWQNRRGPSLLIPSSAFNGLGRLFNLPGFSLRLFCIAYSALLF